MTIFGNPLETWENSMTGYSYTTTSTWRIWPDKRVDIGFFYEEITIKRWAIEEIQQQPFF